LSASVIEQGEELNERSALLEMILANPADDTYRLVLADLLREMNDPSEEARGRFLWAGVTAARFRDVDVIDDPIYYMAQMEIEAVAIAGYPSRWLGELGIGARKLEAGASWGWGSVYDRVTVRIGKSTSIFARGMLTQLNTTLAEWYQVASQVLNCAPLETVDIADVLGLSFSIGQRDAGWVLSARLHVPSRRIPLLSGPIPTSYSPSPFLIETAADWSVEERFPTRAELIARLVTESKSFIDDLREVAGNRWPR
jgi:uncharacterized protein (TIGR02996 family)